MGMLYKTTDEAYRAGKMAGQERMFTAIATELSRLSVLMERGSPEKFHVAEAACAAALSAKRYIAAVDALENVEASGSA
jgi:hypothetical protein